MQKKIALMFFIIAVMMSVIGIGEPSRANAAAREKTIYDGSVENIINSMSNNAKKSGIKVWGKSYYLDNDEGEKNCSVYIGDDKKSYVVFTLNDDNSVVSAYFFFSKVRYNNIRSFVSPILQGFYAALDLEKYMTDTDKETNQSARDQFYNYLFTPEVENRLALRLPLSRSLNISLSKKKKILLATMNIQEVHYKKFDISFAYNVQ